LKRTVVLTFNSYFMKALIPFMLAMVFLIPASFSQVDKTQMSLDVSKKYQQNIGQLDHPQMMGIDKIFIRII